MKKLVFFIALAAFGQQTGYKYNPFTQNLDLAGNGFTAPSGYSWTISGLTTDTKTAATHGQGTMPDVMCWQSSNGEKVSPQVLNPSFLGDITVNFSPAFTGTCKIVGPGVNTGAAGDVVGPAGATAGALACYSGTSGKIIAGCTPLSTVGAVPYVSSAGVLNQDASRFQYVPGANNSLNLSGNSSSLLLFNGTASGIGTTGATGLRVQTNSLDRFYLTPSTGNLLLGGTTFTDGNFKFDIQASGTTGTLRVYDQGGAGSTLAVIQAGASQSGNLLSVRDNSGTSMFYVDAGGSAYSINNLGAVSGGVIKATIEGTTGLRIASDIGVKFSSTTVFNGTPDSGIARNAAGVIEGNNGTAGTLRDFLARQYRNTPVAVTSLQTCNAGNKGSSASVNDALAPAWGATVANGGAAYALVTCNGTNWTVIGI